MILVDVRTAPYSRYSPHFNKESLEFELPRHSIQYFYAGRYLGGRPSDPRLYKSRQLPEEGVDFLHAVDYPEIMKRKWFIQAIEQLLQIADQDLTAIMCSEEDPADCHRHHLIAKYLLDNHPEIKVIHIRGDGTTYGAHTILKSVNEPKAEQGTLF
jgi:uncharacterized protein (DUF488 family)